MIQAGYPTFLLVFDFTTQQKIGDMLLQVLCELHTSICIFMRTFISGDPA